MTKSIAEVLQGWDEHDLSNLGKLLDMKIPADVKSIEHCFKWLFHSKTLADAEMMARNLKARLNNEPLLKNSESLRPFPSYDELLLGACGNMKAAESGASLTDHELFLSHAVILSALQAMTPRQRAAVLITTVDPAKIFEGANIPGKNLGAQATTLAMLGAAQASGFGVFAASTTALGFLTHAVGVTLPFVVYTGLSSTIAFAIGPAGWLSAGVWTAWTLTKAEWKKVTPGLVYIIARNARGHIP